MSTGSKKNIGKVAAVKTQFTWCIDEISKYCHLSVIESPVFETSSADGENSWKLILSADDDECENSEQNSENVEKSFGIYLKSLNPTVVKAMVSFYILSALDKELEVETLDDHEFKPKDCSGYTHFIKRQLLSKRFSRYTFDDCLTIVCTITTENFIEIELKKKNDGEEKQLQLLELKNFAKLFDEPDFSDIVLVVGEQQIHAHKCILANRSPVFKAMFTHDMSETKNNRVEISDVSYDAIRRMLLFIYRGTLPVFYHRLSGKEPQGRPMMDVLIAAEKYQLLTLKKECEEILSELLKVGNIFEYLNFSDMHNASYLKEKAMEFIVKYGKEIVELPSFEKNCTELNPNIFSEVLKALVIKKRKIK